ncbi:MAG: tRNA pseudouridine(54/55) synthase Pus10, partial [Planctomycetes bacterium]|nr:tRNA pseudouridine(54/55) synthase Pus10 [Planctomycetota bacterium]
MQDRPQAKLFVEGRYKKLSRDLPQTVFFCPECKGHPRRRKNCTKCEGFGKLSRESVQELIGWVLGKACGTRKHKFHGAGREDVDVRMLGRGRPFIMELVGPRILDANLAEIEAQINDRNAGRLEVEGLHWTEKERVRVIKETP